MVTEKKECRACGTPFGLKILLDLGNQAIVDFVSMRGEEPRGRAPLQLIRCSNPSCGLVQLRHTVDADTLYRTFWYRSGMNPQMCEALEDIVVAARAKVPLNVGDAVCDIGSNDGRLLASYPPGVFKVGFEPAEEMAKESRRNLFVVGGAEGGFNIIGDYFDSVEALVALEYRKAFRIITAIAMFYDLDDPKDFLFDVKAVLAQDGVFIIQMNYLGLMVRNMTFDNVSHEHLCYYSLTTLKKILDDVQLEVFDVELNDVNGGSIRAYVGHRGVRPVETAVRELLLQEAIQLSDYTLHGFTESVKGMALVLRNFLIGLKEGGKRIYAYGASTRGAILLQTIFKDIQASDYIIGVAEKDRNKIGRWVAGLDLPIVSEAEARAEADYFFLNPYHFWKSIRDREKEWMLSGGRFIIPLPYPKVMKSSGDGLMGTTPTAYDLQKELETVKR